ncbi:MAG: GNAT family N-acetyltransferase [Pseudomonadota bacterium]
MSRFCTASIAQIDEMLDWAAAEGWNPGLADAAAFHASDPAGFFVALDDARPVAAISVVNHGPDFAFLGLYIVRPAYRGRGIGYGLWQFALAHAGARSVGLDGVPEQQANYAASGFVLAGRTRRFSGHVTPRAHPIRLAEEGDINAMIAAEAACSGTEKPRYLRAWFTQDPERKTLIDEGGFCTVRRCRDGAKIGPLVAQDAAAATRLIQHAARHYGTALIIDVPESSTALSEICAGFDMQPSFETARMYRGPAPVGSGGLFAVTTLELG